MDGKDTGAVDLNNLAMILRGDNADFDGATRMKRDDVSSQESSFHNSLNSDVFVEHRLSRPGYPAARSTEGSYGAPLTAHFVNEGRPDVNSRNNLFANDELPADRKGSFVTNGRGKISLNAEESPNMSIKSSFHGEQQFAYASDKKVPSIQQLEPMSIKSSFHGEQPFAHASDKKIPSVQQLEPMSIKSSFHGEQPFAHASDKKVPSVNHLGHYVTKDSRFQENPKFTALGSEISKKIGNVANSDNDIIISSDGLVIDQTLPQKTTCQHCLMLKRKIIVPKMKNGHPEPVYCDRHAHTPPRGLNKSKSPQGGPGSNNKNKKTALNKDNTPPRQAVGSDSKANKNLGDQNLKKLLEATEGDLYEKIAELKKMGIRNDLLQDELNKLENNNYDLQKQIVQANKAYQGSMEKIESLLKQIKRHLKTDLNLYEKINTTAMSGSSNEWNALSLEVPPMRAEAEDILRKIRSRFWETVEVQDAEAYLGSLKDIKAVRREALNAMADNIAQKEAMQKLEKYISDLEGQINGMLGDPKVANKNNIMKVVQLSKELKDSGLREVELRRALEEARSQIGNSNLGGSGAQDGVSQQRFDELQDELKRREEMMDHMQKELDKFRSGAYKPKITMTDDVEEAIRQLSSIILSKEGGALTDKTKRILKDILPEIFSKNFERTEQRIRELEEQNKRLLDQNDEDLRRGGFLVNTAVELCSNLFELIAVFEDNQGSSLPVGLRRYRDGLYEEKPKLESTYEELERCLREYKKRLEQQGKELNTLDADKLGPRSSFMPFREPIFGYAKDNNKAVDDGTTVGGPQSLEDLIEENKNIKWKLESIQMENTSLRVQVDTLKENEDIINGSLANLRLKYEAAMRGGKTTPKKELLDTGTFSKMSKLGGKSGDTSFSVLHETGNDVNWMKTKVAESTDYLMMMHIQAFAVEDQIRKVEHGTLLEDQGGASISRKADNLVATELKKVFSFEN